MDFEPSSIFRFGPAHRKAENKHEQPSNKPSICARKGWECIAIVFGEARDVRAIWVYL